MDEEAKAERLQISDQLFGLIRMLGFTLAHDDGSPAVRDQAVKITYWIGDLAERLHAIENPECAAGSHGGVDARDGLPAPGTVH